MPRIEIHYCKPSDFGDGYAAGSTRITLHDENSLAEWIGNSLLQGKPILITGIVWLPPGSVK